MLEILMSDPLESIRRNYGKFAFCCQNYGKVAFLLLELWEPIRRNYGNLFFGRNCGKITFFYFSNFAVEILIDQVHIKIKSRSSEIRSKINDLRFKCMNNTYCVS
jgi:hypothetical protein